MKVRWGVSATEVRFPHDRATFDVPDDAVVVQFRGHDRIRKFCDWYEIIDEEEEQT